MSNERYSVIIDTDIGSDCDDTWAINLALKSPEIDLLALTTVGYKPMVRARIAKKLSLLAKRPEVPVFAGLAKPIGKSPRLWSRLCGGFPSFFVERLNLRIQRASLRKELGQKKLPTNLLHVGDDCAVEKIIQLAKQHQAIEFVAIGPLSNLATAIQRAPELIENIKRVTIMGGYLGQLPTYPNILCGRREMSVKHDYNIQADPEAAEIVFLSGLNIRLVTADVTLKTWLNPKDIQMLREIKSNAMSAALKQCKWWSFLQSLLLRTCCTNNLGFMHDPLTISALINDKLCEFKRINVRLYQERGLLKFGLVPENGTSSKEVSFECAISVDCKTFKRFFISRISMLGERSS
ncbi:nucleoside hydrolase [Agarivorans sp. JK6]|uniref:nucleoside hydrolase n=1 Tax=Agarivorans sp. JK6 TaxID=2997426 RepID=UPI0038736FD3